MSCTQSFFSCCSKLQDLDAFEIDRCIDDAFEIDLDGSTELPLFSDARSTAESELPWDPLEARIRQEVEDWPDVIGGPVVSQPYAATPADRALRFVRENPGAVFPTRVELRTGCCKEPTVIEWHPWKANGNSAVRYTKEGFTKKVFFFGNPYVNLAQIVQVNEHRQVTHNSILVRSNMRVSNDYPEVKPEHAEPIHQSAGTIEALARPSFLTRPSHGSGTAAERALQFVTSQPGAVYPTHIENNDNTTTWEDWRMEGDYLVRDGTVEYGPVPIAGQIKGYLRQIVKTDQRGNVTYNNIRSSKNPLKPVGDIDFQ